MARLGLAQYGFVAIGDATTQEGRTFKGRQASRHAQMPGILCMGALALPGITSTPRASRVLAFKAL